MDQKIRKLNSLKEEKRNIIINIVLSGAVGLGVPIINNFTMVFSTSVTKVVFLICALVGLIKSYELPYINKEIFDTTYDLDDENTEAALTSLKIISDEMKRLEEQEMLEELAEEQNYEVDDIIDEVKQFDSIDDLDGWRTYIPTSYNGENILLEVETKSQSRKLQRK